MPKRRRRKIGVEEGLEYFDADFDKLAREEREAYEDIRENLIKPLLEAGLVDDEEEEEEP